MKELQKLILPVGAAVAAKIPGMVIELRDYWRARPVVSKPAVSPRAPKVGRNLPYSVAHTMALQIRK